MSLTPYIDNRLKLAGDRDLGNLTGLEKTKFAYRIFRKDSKNYQKRQDRKESEIKDNWTEIYQLIGFDNVFQGVWFQGVTQLAQQRGCRFSAIPIILSVFVSLATIVGVYVKTSNLRDLEKSLHKDKLYSEVLQSYIDKCEREAVAFDFDEIGAVADNSHHRLESKFVKETLVNRKRRILLLVSLTIASILFAWFIHLIICGQYV